MAQYKLVVYFLCTPRREGSKYFLFCHGFDGLGGLSQVFLSLAEFVCHGLVVSVANGRSKSACSGFAREGAKARRREVCLVLPRI